MDERGSMNVLLILTEGTMRIPMSPNAANSSIETKEEAIVCGISGQAIFLTAPF